MRPTISLCAERRKVPPSPSTGHQSPMFSLSGFAAIRPREPVRVPMGACAANSRPYDGRACRSSRSPIQREAGMKRASGAHHWLDHRGLLLPSVSPPLPTRPRGGYARSQWLRALVECRMRWTSDVGTGRRPAASSGIFQRFGRRGLDRPDGRGASYSGRAEASPRQQAERLMRRWRGTHAIRTGAAIVAGRPFGRRFTGTDTCLLADEDRGRGRARQPAHRTVHASGHQPAVVSQLF